MCLIYNLRNLKSLITNDVNSIFIFACLKKPEMVQISWEEEERNVISIKSSSAGAW